jgi:hypothetical protein
MSALSQRRQVAAVQIAAGLSCFMTALDILFPVQGQFTGLMPPAG